VAEVVVVVMEGGEWGKESSIFFEVISSRATVEPAEQLLNHPWDLPPAGQATYNSGKAILKKWGFQELRKKLKQHQ